MPTQHPRINITLEPDCMTAVAQLADVRGQSVSATAKALIIEALGLQEDRYLSTLAGERENATTRWISHGDAWK